MRPDPRLRKRSEFQLVYNRGMRVPGRFVVLFGLAHTGGACRLGITVSRKVGTAVVRNRARRRIRELFRRQPATSLFAGDVVVNARRACAGVRWSELEQDFTQCLARLVTKAARDASQSGC
ncbi:MAG TPA: ribonuclease P protein component [Thermoanaerobaculaceae bacterium]|nr:ribonuclease P protein component [Acidobacteriota bacterium]NLH10226.1 ribonuclease P protein component [Holophagae bacterium]HPW55261.1 ribonuclease P protein component [Thermoanaerobaculaceae bacterium]